MYILIAIISLVVGVFAGALLFREQNVGTLHIDKSHDAKDYYFFEIDDLEELEKKSSINLKVEVKG